MTVDVRSVSGRRNLSQFIRLPREIYAGESGFSPPLDYERYEFLRPDRAPICLRGQVQYWIAWNGTKPVGRISAQIDPVSINSWGEPIGMFGCLDAIDDARVVRGLLTTVARWLAERGMEKVRGPFSLSINEEPGLLVEGQNATAMLLSPWHPIYLARHVEAAGLRPVKDLLAYALDPRQAGDRGLSRIPDRLLGNFSLRRPNLRRFGREAEVIRSLFNDAWSQNWGFVPITRDEMASIAKSLRPLILEDSVIIAELDGVPVGFAMCVPNVFDLTHGFNGRMFPINWAKLAWRLYRKSYKSARILMMGVRSDLQFRPLGAVLPMVMIKELLERGRNYDLREVEMGWVLEDNRRVRSLIEANGGYVSKRFRLFEGPTVGHD